MIVNDLLENQETSESFKQLINESEILLANNIADFFFLGTSKEEWDIEEDFPNIAPVFPKMVITYKQPSFSNNQGDLVAQPNCEFLFIIVAEELPDYTGWLVIHPGDKEIQIKREPDWKWRLEIYSFIKLSREFEGKLAFIAEAHIFVNGEGKICSAKNIISFINPSIPLFPSFKEEYLGLYHVPFLTLSFMHCKNTILETVEPPERLNLRRVKNGKKPLITYKVLNIHPIKKILEIEGQSQKTGLKMALHICRGHFKDFTERGLFGKYHGLYWWDAHARGNAKEGIALKDYRVHSK